MIDVWVLYVLSGDSAFITVSHCNYVVQTLLLFKPIYYINSSLLTL